MEKYCARPSRVTRLIASANGAGRDSRVTAQTKRCEAGSRPRSTSDMNENVTCRCAGAVRLNTVMRSSSVLP